MTSEEFYKRSLRIQTAALALQFMQLMTALKLNRQELGNDVVREGAELAADLVKEAVPEDAL